MKEEKVQITFYKCQLCYHVADSFYFIHNKCPICGSDDIDDADFDPYQEDDDDDELWN